MALGDAPGYKPCMQDTAPRSTIVIAGVASMTGFARVPGAHGALSWTWEARSVNHRGLDVRVRLPPRFDTLEPRVREGLAKRITRGSVTVALDMRRQSVAGALTINRDMIERITQLQSELGMRVDQGPLRLDLLLGLRGVLEASDSEEPTAPDPECEASLVATLGTALDALAAMRASEGQRLGALLAGQIDMIESLTREARDLASLQPAMIAEKLQRQVAQLLGDSALSPDRLAQEIALLATRSDATEELDRLFAHVAAARELLATGGPIGRKLDFLSQEFNREANTLTAKSGDIAVTRIGLALKGTIDQFREQVQNVE
jgi:uncharacterized protein (TIGR00255 family)